MIVSRPPPQLCYNATACSIYVAALSYSYSLYRLKLTFPPKVSNKVIQLFIFFYFNLLITSTYTFSASYSSYSCFGNSYYYFLASFTFQTRLIIYRSTHVQNSILAWIITSFRLRSNFEHVYFCKSIGPNLTFDIDCK